MTKVYNDLNRMERKLQKISIISLGLQYGPLFGYTLNKDMFYIWLLLTFVGSISLLVKLWWIRPELRAKILVYELTLTTAFIVWFFSEAIHVPIIIKQLVFFLVIVVLGHWYFKLLYEGKLSKPSNE